MSPFHFSRKFKRCTGVAPMRYVMLCRIHAAQVRLAQTSEQQAETAYACGFASQAHFCTAFKAATKMTPCEYRRSRN